MALKTYGSIYFNTDDKHWIIKDAKPHVCIKLKAIFAQIGKTETSPFEFNNKPETCSDLLWFLHRYPLQISDGDLTRLQRGDKAHIEYLNELESIITPNYTPRPISLKGDYQSRQYQLIGRDLFLRRKRILNGDDIGLGKTLIGILALTDPRTLPGAVVVETHMQLQWRDRIEQFTDLKVHMIKETRPYNLPEADVYLFKYSQLAGWVDTFSNGFFKSVQFDEVQALRKSGSNRYCAASALSEAAEYVSGYSATPIYNMGSEIYNVLDIIDPGCLGDFNDFMREWTGYSDQVKDPDALGSYLRDNFLILRRTRKEVKMELPKINKIIQNVEFDHKEYDSHQDLLKKLAVSVLNGSFEESGQASRELDMRLRHMTGVSKARGVAAFVRMLLQSGEPVVLGGWHRDVYDIWAEELADFKPVFYTGEESPAQKEKSKQAFMDGETDLFIISNRSGAGLDGLQHRCSTVVHGELDWSPMVHEQLTGRIDRDGQKNPVTSFYLTVDYGSDPVIIQLLGIKSSQSHGIMNPGIEAPTQYSDDSRIKLIANYILKKGSFDN
jgi:SNF2 family DNA or RNA helicase